MNRNFYRLSKYHVNITLLTAACMALFSMGTRSQQEAPNYLSLSTGAYPVELSPNTKALKVDFSQALKLMDGDHTPFILNRRPGDASTTVDIVLRLPATTTFSSFRIPNVWETPSPSQTFIQGIQIFGAMNYEPGNVDSSAFARLAEHSLQKHTSKNQMTEVEVQQIVPVRWIKISLSGGINIKSSKMFFQFSELIGHGVQVVAALADNFSGSWKGRGVKLQLRQKDASVSGCYDRNGTLSGTVSGNILRATGKELRTGVESLFILAVDDNGAIQGLRSSNGAPFANYSASSEHLELTQCQDWPTARLGCDSIIHGIQFEFNSAVISHQSATVLTQLSRGLQASLSAQITIEGHTSSEGSADYNLQLSQQRAQSVLQHLQENGVSAARLNALGLGESQPIASNETDAGRSLNRRVKVVCSD